MNNLETQYKAELCTALMVLEEIAATLKTHHAQGQAAEGVSDA